MTYPENLKSAIEDIMYRNPSATASYVNHVFKFEYGKDIAMDTIISCMEQLQLDDYENAEAMEAHDRAHMVNYIEFPNTNGGGI